MATIVTRPATNEYRDNWEATFGKKKDGGVCDCCGREVPKIKIVGGGLAFCDPPESCIGNESGPNR